jgi:hypothetical protein
MTTVGFETTISAGEWPKTYALDRAVTGTGTTRLGPLINILNINITIIVETESNLSSPLRKENIDLKFVIRKRCGPLLLKITNLAHVVLYSSKK